MDLIKLTDEDYKDRIASIPGGLVLIHKKLCPHCLNMTKVIEKFLAARGENDLLPVMGLDSEENPKALEELSIERVPTLLVVKNGKVVAKRMGLMNPRELAAFYTDSHNQESRREV